MDFSTGVENISLDEAAEEIQAVAEMYLNKKKEKNMELNKLKQNIHDILFEEKEQIPEGVYIKLMELLKN